jgi:tetratricopeptide (TPR) repeat protein
LALLPIVTLLASAPLACRGPTREAALSIDPLLQRAEAQLVLGEIDEAEASIGEALAIAPADPRALEALARVRLARDDAEGALELYARLAANGYELPAAVQREHCRALERAAEQQLAAGYSQRAQEHVQESAAVACPQRPELRARAFTAEAERERAAGHPEQALFLYREAIESDPSRVAAYRGAAELLLEQGRTTPALNLLSIGLERHPRDLRLQVLMVEALARP